MMGPGPELDRVIAEKIFGVKIHAPAPGGVKGEFPEYSTDIKAAFEVVEKLRQQDILMNVAPRPQSGFIVNYIRWNPEIKFGELQTENSASDLAAHAICLAALKAVGVGVGGCG